MKLFKKQGSGFRAWGSMQFAAFVLGSFVVWIDRAASGSGLQGFHGLSRMFSGLRCCGIEPFRS